VDGTVNALAWDGTHLYAGGEFWTAGGVSAAGIAMWDGTGWSALGSGVNHTVKALALGGTNLYAGGEFTTAGGVTANYIARWNGSGWRPMPASGEGISGDLDAYHAVVALAWAGTNLYAGGDFTVAGGVVANHVAKWDGTEWSGLGSGTNGGNANGPVSAVAWDGTNLYAGGYFRTAGGVAANYIAKWDGSEWSALGTGLDDCVNDLTCGGGNLYAGGAFTTAGGVSASYIAKWNGSEWSALGAGLEDGVSAMAWDGANLYVGGWFTSAGGVPANHIAKWDGKEWSALGTGLNGLVYALAWDGTNLYAGGDFTTAGDAAVNHIAQWDGSRWTALGTGVDGLVNALAWNGTNLYVGGQFRTAGGVIANNIAVWDGAVWSALGSGTNGPVWALVCDATNLYVGGNFTTSGAKPSSCIGHWCAPPEAPAAPFFTNVTTTALTINWTAVTGAASYNVWRASGGACVGAVKITESPVSRTSYRDFALTCSTTYSYFITAGNDCGASIDGTCAPVMTAPCCPAITLSPSSLPGGAVGVGYSQTLAASGGTAPYTYTLASGDSPGGLSFSTNGVLSGTPATAGTFAFTVAATDSNQCTGSGAYTVTISGGCAAITLLPSNLPRASVGTAYSQTISASGGTSPYVFKVTSGSLPAGLILDSSGVLAGTPTATGTFGITVTATDDASCEGSRTYSLSVVDPLAVSISSDETSGTTPFSVGFSSDVTGGDGNYEYHWDFGDGTSLAVPNPTKVYDTAGSYNARLTVTDGASQSAVSNTLNMTVFAPMELTLSASPAGGTAPLAVGFATQASGGDGHYTYDYEYGDGTSGSEPYHTYSQAGTYAAKVNASDASGHTATSQAVTIKAYAPLSVTIAASSTSGTAPFSVDFTSNVTGGDGVYTLAWDFGDGGSGSGATATHTYASTGTFHVTAVATDAAGHSATSSALAITVTPVPPVIASAHKQHAPFRIVLLGSNFQPNCTATINGTPVDVKYKNGGKIKLKHCKALCPKGVAVVIVITNPDGGVSAPFQFTK
jgi:PKD repeat protein